MPYKYRGESKCEENVENYGTTEGIEETSPSPPLQEAEPQGDDGQQPEAH